MFLTQGQPKIEHYKLYKYIILVYIGLYLIVQVYLIIWKLGVYINQIYM